MAVAARDEVEASRQQVREAHEQTAAILQQVDAAQSQVEASNRQAELARQTLEASIQPLLVDVPVGPVSPGEQVFFPDDAGPTVIGPPGRIWVADPSPQLRCAIPFRNVGAGVALAKGAELSVGNWRHTRYRISRGVISPGEWTWVAFSITREDAAGAPLEPLLSNAFTVSIAYTNARGARPVWSTAVVFRDPEPRYPEQENFVRQLLLYEFEDYSRGGAGYFASTGPVCNPP
jgi:hypothetical protein